ncbi:hypothetical protein MRB53_010342 [Persea americana]|uniref:Uncharacterized protein n=1 Tax=Persea americana TaxID=3435 RepID=A0ACC2LRJ7_PERAE|nr:hypothetical protein MRB53_010342 [Persea americana]
MGEVGLREDGGEGCNGRWRDMMEMIEGVVCVWVLRRRKNRSGWWRRKDGGRSKRRDGEMGDGFWEQRDGGRWKGGDDGEMVVSLGLALCCCCFFFITSYSLLPRNSRPPCWPCPQQPLLHSLPCNSGRPSPRYLFLLPASPLTCITRPSLSLPGRPAETAITTLQRPPPCYSGPLPAQVPPGHSPAQPATIFLPLYRPLLLLFQQSLLSPLPRGHHGTAPPAVTLT